MIKPLRLILFVFIFSLLVFFSSNAYAFGVYLTGAGAEIKWSSPQATYYINATGGPAAASTAVQAAMQTWTDVTTSQFTFIYGGAPPGGRDFSSHGLNDGVNIVTFGSFTPWGPQYAGVLAENAFWYWASGEILDSDIAFNTDFSWKTDGSGGYFDVQNIGTHELGHSLSLSDLYDILADSEKTMYGYGSAGEAKKRTLDPDDINGITYLYPCTYSIGPTSETLSCPSGAGSGINVTTQSGCPWTAVSNNAWITVTSGASGSSSGSVGYSVSENTGASSRTGTISMSGQIFTTSLLWEVTYSYGTVRYRTGTITAAAFPSSFTATQTMSGGYTLTVSKSGTGTVTSSPAGIDCGATCSFSTCQAVTLTATPGTCLALTGWSGACTGTGGCSVAMDAAKAVTATFGPSAPVVDFTCSPSSGPVPLTVDFTDLSTCGPIISWYWDLSDSATSTLQNPLHVYNPDLGSNLTVSYNISLTATNAIGSNTLTKTSCVTAQCSGVPVKIVRTGTTYSTIQAAYDAAITGDTIQCQGYRFTGNLNVNRDINVTLDGGYGCDYTSNSGRYSELKGQLTTLPGGGQLTIKSFRIVN